MNKKLCLALLLAACTSAIGVQASTDDVNDIRNDTLAKNEWQQTRNDKLHGIKVYVKNEEGKRVRSFKVEAMIDANIETVARIHADVENYPRWYFSVLEARMLKRVSDKEFLFYMVHDAPVGMPDRDVVIRTVIEPMTENHPYITLKMSAANDIMLPQPPYQRMLAENFTVKMTPVDKDKTLVVAEGIIDPGGSAPAWAVNFVQGKAPYTNMMGLQRMATLSQYRNSKEVLSLAFFE